MMMKHTGRSEIRFDQEDLTLWHAISDTATIRVSVLVVIVALAARIVVFGDPLVHVDEEFYRLVGDRMLDGAIPYVDIWDRKPIGLFVVFAGLRLIAGQRLWVYDAVALGAVVATSTMIFVLARRSAGVVGGAMSALLYVVLLDLAGGESCQSPVWYNLPVAVAVAVLIFSRTPERRFTGNFRWPGVVAMALIGVAMQIKYNAMFEGAFVGICFIVFSVYRGRALPALIGDVVIWVGCALLPTLAAAGSYLAIGHFHEWLFANFVSILDRGHEPHAVVLKRISDLAILTVPLLAAIPLRRLDARSLDDAARQDIFVLDAWAASALLGVLVFGTWYNHYALPLFVPLSVAAGPLAMGRRGRIYLVTLLASVAIWGQHILQRHLAMRGDARLLERVTTALAGHHGCVFVYDGLVAAYESSRSCLPTSRVFPNHFAGLSERGATGIVEEDLVREVMARRPDRVTTEEPGYPNENPRSRAALYSVLRADYHVLASFPRGDRRLVVYGLHTKSA